MQSVVFAVCQFAGIAAVCLIAVSLFGIALGKINA